MERGTPAGMERRERAFPAGGRSERNKAARMAAPQPDSARSREVRPEACRGQAVSEDPARQTERQPAALALGRHLRFMMQKAA